MVTGISNLVELESLPFGSIVLYKEGPALRVQSDWYDVGIVVPSNLPPEMYKIIEAGFNTVVKQTYASPVMDSIRDDAKNYCYEWDTLSQVNQAKVVPHRLHKDFPTEKTLVAARAPVPENWEIAKKFAKGLENFLKETE